MPAIIQSYLSFTDLITFCKFRMCYYIWSMSVCGSEQSLNSSFTHIVYYKVCHMCHVAICLWDLRSDFSGNHPLLLALSNHPVTQHHYLRRRIKELIMFSSFLSRNTSVVKAFFASGWRLLLQGSRSSRPGLTNIQTCGPQASAALCGPAVGWSWLALF